MLHVFQMRWVEVEVVTAAEFLPPLAGTLGHHPRMPAHPLQAFQWYSSTSLPESTRWVIWIREDGKSETSHWETSEGLWNCWFKRDQLLEKEIFNLSLLFFFKSSKEKKTAVWHTGKDKFDSRYNYELKHFNLKSPKCKKHKNYKSKCLKYI